MSLGHSKTENINIMLVDWCPYNTAKQEIVILYLKIGVPTTQQNRKYQYYTYRLVSLRHSKTENINIMLVDWCPYNTAKQEIVILYLTIGVPTTQQNRKSKYYTCRLVSLEHSKTGNSNIILEDWCPYKTAKQKI